MLNYAFRVSRLRVTALVGNIAFASSLYGETSAETDPGPLDTLSYLLGILGTAWNYPLRVIDNNPITIGSLFIGFFLILLGYQVAKRVSRQLAKKVFPRVAVDRAAVDTFETLSFYVLLLFLTIFALKIANVPLTAFTVVGGAAAIGLGFGSQAVLNNFISGIILMLERPIKLGDFVEVDDAIGTVERIGIRSTQVLLNDNRHVIVPNSSFLEKNVLNWTLANRELRLAVDVGVAYGSDTLKVKELLELAAHSDERIIKDPVPLVLFTDFGDNSLAFRLMFWVRVHRIVDRVSIQSSLRFHIDQLFKENNIVIAFPQRDVHLDTLSPLEVRITPNPK